MNGPQRWNFWNNESFFYIGNLSGIPNCLVEGSSTPVGEAIRCLGHVNRHLSWEIIDPLTCAVDDLHVLLYNKMSTEWCE